MIEKPKSVVVGDGECIFCGAPLLVKATKTGFLSFSCPNVLDGGCNLQTFARSDKSCRLIGEKMVKKWRQVEYRQAYMGEAPPAPALAPELDPEPAPAPAPANDNPAPSPDPGSRKETREEREARIERELFGE